MRSRLATDDRSQAFTLEGFVAALLLVMAVLFAQQAIVITEDTGGEVDRTQLLQGERELKDALMIAASDEDEDLSYTVRNWVPDQGGVWCGFDRAEQSVACDDELDALGAILEEHFDQSDVQVEFIWLDGDDGRESETVGDEIPSGPSQVTASYTVTLHDQQLLTSPDSGDIPLDDAYDDHGYPIPPHSDDGDNDVYNVVEVRLTWHR